MTGNVPYYGGRFTPAQAYAVSHPGGPPPAPPPPDQIKAMNALRHLLDIGVLTPEEYERMRARVPS
jgi:hypothetical protein